MLKMHMKTHEKENKLPRLVSSYEADHRICLTLTLTPNQKAVKQFDG